MPLKDRQLYEETEKRKYAEWIQREVDGVGMDHTESDDESEYGEFDYANLNDQLS